jgi:hypothetical protein
MKKWEFPKRMAHSINPKGTKSTSPQPHNRTQNLISNQKSNFIKQTNIFFELFLNKIFILYIMTQWTDFVKAFAKKHNMSYKDALINAKDEYSKSKKKGGELSASNLKDLLNASYDARANVGDFQIDKDLSTSNSKVYYNPTTNQSVVAHKGTTGIKDWANNAIYALGGTRAYKQTDRFKDAEKVQKKAESKYGAENISTIGHSQGGLQAELLGKKTNETITLDKATRPFGNKKSDNQFDIRSKTDIVSALNPFQKDNKKEITLKSKSLNPLKSHDIGQLNKLAPDRIIGQGMRYY